MQNRKLISILATAVLFASQPVQAKNVYIWGIPHYTQDSPYLCGVAASRMWIAKIKRHHGVPGESQVRWTFWPLLENGIHAGEIKSILHRYTGKRFDYHNVSKRNAEKYIYKELRKQGRPIIIAAATRYADGRVKPGQHWLLVWAANTSKDKHYGYKSKWVLMHDSLFGSRHRGFHTVDHNIRVYRNELYNTQWLKIPALGKRQLVED